jgi:TPR repeat protein
MQRLLGSRLAAPTLALTALAVSLIPGAPLAQDAEPVPAAAARRFYPPATFDFAAPLDADVRRDCGCVSDAFAIVPSTFEGGPGGPLQPPERVLRKMAEDFARFAASAPIPLHRDPRDDWPLGQALLAAPDVLRVDRETAMRRAVAYLTRAAAADSREAQAEIGYLHLLGWGLPQSDAHAAYWFDRSARGGYSPAQLAIGALYLAGRGVERNEQTALAWFRHAGATRLVGDAYACGVGVPESPAAATEFYQRSGEPEARRQLASLYANGCGVGLDEAKALEHYEEAAQAGDPAAQVALADLLMRTSKDGGPQPGQAYMWAELAFVRLGDGELRRRAGDVRAAAASVISEAERRGQGEMVVALLQSAEPDPGHPRGGSR